MFPYMIGKDNVGAYRVAFEYSLRNFASKDPVEMANNSGSTFDSESSTIIMNSLGQWINVKFPEGIVTFRNSSHLPVWYWRLVILNYLYRADNTPISNRLISYRELEDGQVFYPAFLRESIKPLIKKLSLEPAARIKQACLKLTAHIQENADICAVFDFLPRFPVTVKIWLNDEEIGGSANILFDASANCYLHTEDIAAAGNLVSYFLIKQYEMMFELDKNKSIAEPYE